MNRNARLFLFALLLYTARFAFCYAGYLKNYMWLDVGDESHIYLLGLKFFTAHEFPYWGPDIVYTSSYLVGGMQGFLVGLPLFIWQHPFAPYLFLFIVLTVALLYLSSYITKLFPTVRPWLIYTVIALSPYSTHTGLKIINPAYVLCFSIPFMLSFIETINVFEIKLIKPSWRFFWMGLGTIAVFQLHASWILLLCFFLIAWLYILFTEKNIYTILKYLFFSCLGVSIGLSTLLPTILNYGIDVLFIQGKNAAFSWGNITDFGSILFYFITLVGYEMNSFSNVYCFGPLLEKYSILGAVVFGVLQVLGLLLFVAQIVVLFLKKWRPFVFAERRFLLVGLATISLLTAMYMFSFVRPGTHAIICLYPLSAIYLIWFFNSLISITKLKYFWIGGFYFLLTVYYGIIIDFTTKIPELGYREKAFKAIENKDASIFETPRFAYPKSKNK